MDFDKINFDEIIPSEYNPRKIRREELKRLEENINEFGLVDPIIINLKNHHIIGGHQRYKALQNKYSKSGGGNQELNLIKLGDIGWVFEDKELTLDDELREKALNLSLNKISGEWDYDKLGLLFEELENSKFDLSFTGFTSYEIEHIIIPDDLKEQFNEVNKIQEGKMDATHNTGESNDKIDDNELSVEDDTLETDDADDVMISSDEIEELTQHKCPKCGYEW